MPLRGSRAENFLSKFQKKTDVRKIKNAREIFCEATPPSSAAGGGRGAQELVSFTTRVARTIRNAHKFLLKWVRAKLIKEHNKGLREVSEREIGAEPFCRTAKRRRIEWAKLNSGFQIQDGDFSEMRRFVMQKALWIKSISNFLKKQFLIINRFPRYE